jgi:DNA-binding NtrC family response regulator
VSKRGFPRSARTAAPELRTDLGLSISIDAPVLISGDVTSAKRMALAIHQRSARSQGPFIAVSCGSEEPFSRKAEVDLLAAGRLASGGTLFVEHVDRTSPSLQHELMLVLQMTSEPATHANRGVGGARVVVAAGGNLFGKVQAQEFREDLFYRLNVIHLKVPVEAEVPDRLPSVTSTALPEGTARSLVGVTVDSGRSPYATGPSRVQI